MSGAAEVQTPIEDLHITESDHQGPTPEAIGSDAFHSTPQNSRETYGGDKSNPLPDPEENFDEWIEKAGIEELESLTHRLANGSIQVRPGSAAPPASPVAAVDPDTVVPNEVGAPEQAGAHDEPQKGSIRVRIPAAREDDRRAIEIAKAEGISILEAAQRILDERRQQNAAVLDEVFDIEAPDKEQLAPPVPSETKEQPEGLPFATVQEAEDRLYELEEMLDVARHQEYDDEKALALGREIRALRRQLPAIQSAEIAAQETKREAYERQWSEAEAKALKIFPSLSDQHSPLYAEVARLDQEAKAKNPALFAAPDKFLRLAIEAAANIGVAANSSMPAVPAQPVPPRNPAAKGVQSVVSIRPSTPTQAAPRADVEIDSIETVDDLADLDVRLGIGRHTVSRY